MENRELARKIIKGMAENQKKIKQNSFAERLKTNILLKRTGQGQITLKEMTDYLNNISDQKSPLNYKQMYDQYKHNNQEEREMSENLLNPVIDKMFYESICSINSILWKEDLPPQNKKSSKNKDKIIEHDISSSLKKVDEKKIKAPSLRKIKSLQPDLNDEKAL